MSLGIFVSVAVFSFAMGYFLRWAIESHNRIAESCSEIQERCAEAQKKIAEIRRSVREISGQLEKEDRKYSCLYCPHHGLKYVQLYGGLWYGPGHGNSFLDQPQSCEECGDTLLPAQCTESNSKSFLKGES